MLPFCKQYSKSCSFPKSLCIYLIYKQLQVFGFGLRKLGLSRQETRSLPYLNSHFSATKVYVFSQHIKCVKQFRYKARENADK